MEEDNHEIYSSKHYIYGELIVKCWRDFLDVKAEEIKLADQAKVDKPESDRDHENSIQDNSKTELIRLEDTVGLAVD